MILKHASYCSDHVKLLVEHGADVNITGGTKQWTPLFYAAQSGHVTVVELLLDIGADSQVGVAILYQPNTSWCEKLQPRDRFSELVAKTFVGMLLFDCF